MENFILSDKFKIKVDVSKVVKTENTNKKTGSEINPMSDSNKNTFDDYNMGIAIEKTSNVDKSEKIEKKEEEIKKTDSNIFVQKVQAPVNSNIGSVSITTNAKFDEKGNYIGNGNVKGVVQVIGEDGKPVNLNLEITPSLLKDVGIAFVLSQEGTQKINESHEKNYNQLLKSLKTSIENLPQDVKKDLLKETPELYLDRKSYWGNDEAGTFDQSYNRINLYKARNGAVVKDGISSSVIAHELGHSIDYINNDYQTETIKDDFQKLKSLVKNSNAYYQLNDEKEFFAEYYAKKAGVNIFDDFYTMVENSDNQELKTAYKNLTEKCDSILESARNKTPEERVSFDAYKRIETELYRKNIRSVYSSPELKTDYMDLMYSDKINGIYDVFDSNINVLYKYHSYKNNTLENQTEKNVFDTLNSMSKDTAEGKAWGTVKEYLESTLSELRLQ